MIFCRLVTLEHTSECHATSQEATHEHQHRNQGTDQASREEGGTREGTRPAAKKAAPAKAPAQPAKKVATSNRRTTRKAAPKPTAGLAAAAATGKVKFYRQRANRTLRFLPYYAPGTDSRKSAELVQKRRDNGETIGAIAEDMHTSVATVRRLITGLLLAQAVEAGEYDAKWDKATNEVIVNGTGR